MSAKCMWGDCTKPATSQVAILLWAYATLPANRTKRNAARLETPLVVCNGHRGEVKAEHFLNPEGRARILTGMQRAGAALPDFSSAKVDLQEIVGEPVSISELTSDARSRGAEIFEA